MNAATPTGVVHKLSLLDINEEELKFDSVIYNVLLDGLQLP